MIDLLKDNLNRRQLIYWSIMLTEDDIVGHLLRCFRRHRKHCCRSLLCFKCFNADKVYYASSIVYSKHDSQLLVFILRDLLWKHQSLPQRVRLVWGCQVTEGGLNNIKIYKYFGIFIVTATKSMSSMGMSRTMRPSCYYFNFGQAHTEALLG